MEETNHRVMVVVGRFPDVANFVATVSSLLYDNFDLVVAQPLEEEDERDFQGSLRFIGFVTGTEIGGSTLDNQSMGIRATGGMLGATVYDSMEEAIKDATKRLGFDSGEAEIIERAEKITDIVNRFTKFSVEEMEFGRIFTTLVEAGQVNLIRGLIDDEPVMILAMVTSNDEGETRINPMAILISTPSIHEMIELPFGND